MPCFEFDFTLFKEELKQRLKLTCYDRGHQCNEKDGNKDVETVGLCQNNLRPVASSYVEKGYPTVTP